MKGRDIGPGPPQRRMTVPARNFPAPRNVRITSTLFDVDEGFHENRSITSVTSAEKLSLSSKLFLDLPPGGALRYSSPDVHRLDELNGINLKSDLWKTPVQFLGSKTSNKMKPLCPDSFFMSIRPALFVLQLFGLLPISGVFGENSNQLKFNWKSWRIVYQIISLTGIVFVFMCSMLHGVYHGFNYDRSANLIFYGNGILGTLLFLNLARNWKNISECYAKTDVILSDYGYPPGQNSKFFILTVALGIFALAEHILSKAVFILIALGCFEEADDSGDVIHAYLYKQYSQVFSIFGYNLALGLLVTLFNFIATIYWNFADLLLGLVAMSLSARLRQINTRIASVQGQAKPSEFWRKVREEYNAVSVLIKQVDSHVQGIMLLSLGNNLFFICLQLLKSLNRRSSTFQVAYFFFSFSLLLSRAIFVTLSAAGVYDESRESRTVLFSVPHESFCHEVKRFLMQIASDELVLTGCRFFAVTRGLILTIAGTVVTYEIVLVQFKAEGDSEVSMNRTHCSY